MRKKGSSLQLTNVEGFLQIFDPCPKSMMSPSTSATSRGPHLWPGSERPSCDSDMIPSPRIEDT